MAAKAGLHHIKITSGRSAISVVYIAMMLILFASCRSSSVQKSESKNSALDRALVGVAYDYTADQDLPSREIFLKEHPEALRAVGWSVVKRVIQPVNLHDETLSTTQIPLWQSWYDRQDVVRMAEEMLANIPSADRLLRPAVSDQRVDELFDWNSLFWWKVHGTHDTQPMDDRRAQVSSDPNAIHGLSGLSRSLWSPALTKRFIQSYKQLADCAPSDQSNPRFCFSHPIARNAVAIKALWKRSPDGKHPVFDTSSDGIESMLQKKEPTWTPLPDLVQPSPGAIFQQLAPGGGKFDLLALHIMTKELDHWVWVTLWWSPDANTDFGADRPASIAGEWRNYKMCTVIDFKDKENHPTWCSNPYLETGKNLGATNCIGCHQFAGLVSNMEHLETQNLTHERLQKVPDFPADYLWAVTSEPVALSQYFRDALAYFDQF